MHRDDSSDSSSSSDDVRLMARLAEGDRSAMAELVERHQRRFLELAHRYSGDWSAAEDIVQEAFLRVWRAAPGYDPRAGFSTWLYRIVMNLCYDLRKKRRPGQGKPSDFEVIDETADTPLDSLEVRERALAVQRAVARLPERQRVSLILHRFSGLSVRAIAAITGSSESGVESLLVRAYEDLRKKLKKLK